MQVSKTYYTTGYCKYQSGVASNASNEICPRGKYNETPAPTNFTTSNVFLVDSTVDTCHLINYNPHTDIISLSTDACTHPYSCLCQHPKGKCLRLRFCKSEKVHTPVEFYIPKKKKRTEILFKQFLSG